VKSRCLLSIPLKNVTCKNFDGPLPVFVPEASIQAIQPIEQKLPFEVFTHPRFYFKIPAQIQERSKSLADPEVFQCCLMPNHLAKPAIATQKSHCRERSTQRITAHHQKYTGHLICIPAAPSIGIPNTLFSPVHANSGFQADHISYVSVTRGETPLAHCPVTGKVHLISKQTPVLELALEALNWRRKFSVRYQPNAIMLIHASQIVYIIAVRTIWEGYSR